VQPLLQWKTVSVLIVFVAFNIKHAVRMYHVVICGLFIYTIFSTLSHEGTIKKKVVELKMCILIFCTTFVCKN
jgi:fucose permease